MFDYKNISLAIHALNIISVCILFSCYWLGVTCRRTRTNVFIFSVLQQIVKLLIICMISIVWNVFFTLEVCYWISFIKKLFVRFARLQIVLCYLIHHHLKVLYLSNQKIDLLNWNLIFLQGFLRKTKELNENDRQQILLVICYYFSPFFITNLDSRLISSNMFVAVWFQNFSFVVTIWTELKNKQQKRALANITRKYE